MEIFKRLFSVVKQRVGLLSITLDKIYKIKYRVVYLPYSDIKIYRLFLENMMKESTLSIRDHRLPTLQYNIEDLYSNGDVIDTDFVNKLKDLYEAYTKLKSIKKSTLKENAIIKYHEGVLSSFFDTILWFFIHILL